MGEVGQSISPRGKMVNKVLKFLLLVSPLAYMANISLRSFSIRFFHLGVIALVIAALLDTPVRKLAGKKLIAGLLGIGLINILLHRMNVVVMGNVLNIFFGIIALVIIICFCKEPRDYYKYIIGAGVISMVVWGFQQIGFNPILNSSPASEMGGLMGNAPRLATYLAAILPFMPVGLFLLCIGIAVWAKEYTLLIIATVILFLKSKTIATKILIGSVAFGGMMFLHQSIIKSFLSRIEIWKEVLTGFFVQPIAGYGLGVFPYKVEVAPNIDATIFSSLLQFIVCAGLLGAVWLWFVLKAYKKNFTLGANSLAILSLLILSLVEYPFEIPRLWFTELAIIGFFIINKGGSDVSKIYG